MTCTSLARSRGNLDHLVGDGGHVDGLVEGEFLLPLGDPVDLVGHLRHEKARRSS